MLNLKRASDNPILTPKSGSGDNWQEQAAFNPCVVKKDDTYHMLYRALSPVRSHYGVHMELSTVGHATSTDGVHFEDTHQFIKPEHEWEFYGCEDPRVTKLDDTYYIFYTGLSTYPFSAPGIKVACATTKDFKTIDEKHLVTPFNAKAMSLFPDRVDGKITAILTANTDMPPAKIGIAKFDSIEELWNSEYWENWYAYVDDHSLHLQRNDNDHIEIGAPPVKTKDGWLLIYSYIRNYYSDSKIFGIEAVLLDINNPLKVLKRTKEALLVPVEKYETDGIVPNIAFPTGALVEGDTLNVYYGGADTVCCLATCSLDELLAGMQEEKHEEKKVTSLQFTRFDENPILRPNPDNAWEARAVFNPAAVFDNGKIQIIYRAMSMDNISTIGLATSLDGKHILDRLPEPIYVPREEYEKNYEGHNSGCEDPRVTRIDDRFYICYTAYNGHDVPRVAFSSISVEDFRARRWNNWEKPKLISPPGIDDKDACVFPRKVNDKYVFLHRMQMCIWLDYVDSLDFPDEKVLTGKIILQPRKDKWDVEKIGIAGPPIETKDGWLLLYHGIDKDHFYKIGAVLLDLDDPTKIIGQTDNPIFSPETEYEKVGEVGNVVFPCGSVVLEGMLYIYYGGADKVTGVAWIELGALLDELKK